MSLLRDDPEKVRVIIQDDLRNQVAGYSARIKELETAKRNTIDVLRKACKHTHVFKSKNHEGNEIRICACCATIEVVSSQKPFTLKDPIAEISFLEFTDILFFNIATINRLLQLTPATA